MTFDMTGTLTWCIKKNANRRFIDDDSSTTDSEDTEYGVPE